MITDYSISIIIIYKNIRKILKLKVKNKKKFKLKNKEKSKKKFKKLIV